MERKTALAAAGAMVMTSAAAVSALFLTIGSPAQASTPEPAPVVRTEYQIVTVEPEATTVESPSAAASADEVVVYEIEYVEADPVVANPTYDDRDDDSDDDYYEDDYSEDDRSEEDDD